MDRVLITGGNGFLGKHLQEKFNSEGIAYQLYDVDVNEKFDIRHLETLDQQVEQFKPTCIVHLAGVLGTHELWDQASTAIDVNIKGALNVGRVALRRRCRVVSIEQPHVWYNVYEASKLAARRMLTGLSFDKGLRVAFITAHNAFGEWQGFGEGHPQKILPTFAMNAWQAKPLPVWGDGSQLCNLVYAGQVAEVLFDAITQPEKYDDPTQEYNAATNTLWAVDTLAQYVLDYVAAQGGPSGNDFKDGQVKFNKMRRGEQPAMNYPSPDPHWPDLKLSDLHRTIQWYKQHADRLSN
jgi:UDP-glucose 4-epimerase